MSFLERLKSLLRAGGSPPSQNGGNGTGPKDLTCMQAMEQLQEYLDGELDHIPHQEVAHHFSMCKRCYPHLKLEERFRGLLDRSQEEEACPEHLREQVLELLAAETGGDE